MSRQPTNTSGPSTTGAEPDGRGTEITDFTPSCFFAMQPLTPMARVNALLGNQWAFPLWAGFISAFARTSRPPRRDPYTDPNMLAFLRGELQRASVAPSEWQRLLASSKGYAYVNERLWFYPKDGTPKLEVPPVADRVRLITTEHEALGHLGRDRTYSKLRIRYTWPNMHKDVSDTLRTCSACDRIRSSSNVKASEENPLPLGGLFWRWHIDTAGPLPPSTGGHRYVIVMIEAFSKHIELVPVTTLDSTTTATAFRERVLARFGAPVEVTSDNGSEYAGEFHKQLTTHGVDHRSITPGHPEANGAAERTVASCKKGLKRYVLENGTARWHEYLPTIEFGYRVTRHQSTGYSPFFLMYGRHLSHPDQLRDSDVWTSVDHDDPDHVHQLIVQRSQILASAMPTAFERLLKAQKRDAVRFRKIKRRDMSPPACIVSHLEALFTLLRPRSTPWMSTLIAPYCACIKHSLLACLSLKAQMVKPFECVVSCAVLASFQIWSLTSWAWCQRISLVKCAIRPALQILCSSVTSAIKDITCRVSGLLC